MKRKKNGKEKKREKQEKGKESSCQVWWATSQVPAFRKWDPGNQEFKVIFSYMRSDLIESEPSMLGNDFNSSTWEPEAGRSLNLRSA